MGVLTAADARGGCVGKLLGASAGDALRVCVWLRGCRDGVTDKVLDSLDECDRLGVSERLLDRVSLGVGR